MTEDDLLALHVWAGYFILALIVVRVLWGLWAKERRQEPFLIYSLHNLSRE